MPLLINCPSPFLAPRHPHLRAPPHVCCHMCHTHARPCLSTGWALNRRFDLTFGTATVLAQGGGGVPPAINSKSPGMNNNPAGVSNNHQEVTITTSNQQEATSNQQQATRN